MRGRIDAPDREGEQLAGNQRDECPRTGLGRRNKTVKRIGRGVGVEKGYQIIGIISIEIIQVRRRDDGRFHPFSPVHLVRSPLGHRRRTAKRIGGGGGFVNRTAGESNQ